MGFGAFLNAVRGKGFAKLDHMDVSIFFIFSAPGSPERQGRRGVGFLLKIPGGGDLPGGGGRGRGGREGVCRECGGIGGAGG